MAEIGEEGIRDEDLGVCCRPEVGRLSWAEGGEESPNHLFSSCTVEYLVQMYYPVYVSC